MIEVKEKPLVTFGVCAYNQEQFIREAIEGALGQTYSPLQIILSDDGSDDLTFVIMKQMASAYAGPHLLVLNRNGINLGIGGHINRIMELSHGELIVIAAGDDVSLHGRVAVIQARWESEGRPRGSIFSDTIEVAADGRQIGRSSVPRSGAFDLATMFEGKVPPVIGSSHCWHRHVFEVFGPLKEGVVNEDSAIFFRSALLGSVLHIHEPLVCHRIHSANTGGAGRSSATSSKALLRVWETAYARDITLGQNILCDLNRFAELGHHRLDLLVLIVKIQRYLEFSRAALGFVCAGFAERLRMLLPLLIKSPSAACMRPILTQCLLPGGNLAFRAMKATTRSAINRIHRRPAA